MEKLDDLQQQWILINATREMLGIIKRSPNVSYSDAISFAKDISKSLFEKSKTGIDKKTYLDRLRDKYRQEAIGRSKFAAPVTAESLIETRLKDVESLLRKFTLGDERPTRLIKEADDLKELLNPQARNILGLEKTAEPSILVRPDKERVTEHQAIYNDTVASRSAKLFINSHLGKFNEYYDRENDSVFRVTVLHPNPSEAIIGADLIYEQYDETRKRVRIVAIQYKIWNENVFYFSQSDNLDSQLSKMKNHFCKKDFCKDCKGGSNTHDSNYRMSYCMAFLKPTDKLQTPDKLTTTGYHLPICKINAVRTKIGTSYKLELNAIKNQSLKTSTFEELFDAEMIGSRWIDKKELERFYRRNKILEATGRIVLYGQGNKKEILDS
jgi:hypothetical protein